MALDAEFCSAENEDAESGSTAATLLVLGDRLFCANVGDSRVVLSRSRGVIPLSDDQKPSRPDEQARIKSAGGFVMGGRVLGDLAVSRAFGDRRFKDSHELKKISGDRSGAWEEPLVTARPEVRCTQLSFGNDEFVLLACDGLFDVLSNAEACDFARARLSAGDEPAAAAKALTRYAVRVKGSMDNVSVMIVLLQKMKGANFTSSSSSAPAEDTRVSAMAAAKSDVVVPIYPGAPPCSSGSHGSSEKKSQLTPPAREEVSPPANSPSPP